MEFIILTLGYFALLSSMIYKGADVPSIIGAAGSYVALYLGVRKAKETTHGKSNGK